MSIGPVVIVGHWCNKPPINSPIFPLKIPSQIERPGEPLTTPSILILTDLVKEIHISNRKRMKNFALRVLISKNLSTLKSNI